MIACNASPDTSRKPSLRPIAYATPRITHTRGPDGTMRLASAVALEANDPSLAQMFRRAAAAEPSRVFLAERGPRGGWRTLAYAAAQTAVDSIAQALLDRGLSADRPVAILSGNSIDHALLMLAGFTAGIPVAPISVAYSLQSQDHEKLKHIFSLLTPGLVYVDDATAFARPLSALDLADVEVVASHSGPPLGRITAFQDLTATVVGPAVERAASAIQAATIAKFLFTSGSTGLPKGVINTHGMLVANQQSVAQIWPFLAEQPLVLLDWLPWNHTFGGNHNFNLVLRQAGTLYIDGGKPVPGLIDQTVRNLAEVQPTVYFNVPAGYAALLPYLERDETLARSFFARLRLIFYAGAALPQDLWERLDALSARSIGVRVPMTSSWGSTETAPLATAAHFPIERAGVIGVPVPGVELKLVPIGPKTEVRVRGPNVTPGYWKRPDLTAAAFDAEGFYRIGDAVRLADPADPGRGLVFDGRLAEDFKLTTGTWVPVGALRVSILAAVSPVLQDAIVAGENRAFVGVLAWPSPSGCQKLLGTDGVGDTDELIRHTLVRAHLRTCLERFNEKATGSSHRVARVLLLSEPPSIDANEITDKGYINQRLTLERRRDDVERLFAAEPDADILVL